jgi:DNA-binding transcriptional LysR family regulator
MADPLFRNLLSAPALRYFNEVAQTGSFRRAGETLRIAPSAVHRQITLLEARLGTPLFERQPGRGGVKLTAAGEVLKLRIGQAVNQISKAVAEIHELSDVKRGRVSIGVNDTLAGDVISEVIALHHPEAPRLDYNVQTGETEDLMRDVLNGDIDSLLCFGITPKLGLRTIWERHLATMVVVSNEHPLAGRQSITLAECGQYPLTMQNDDEWTRGFLERMFQKGGVRPRILLRTNSFGLMRDVAASGFAISIQTRLPRTDVRERTGLSYIRLKDPVEHYSVLACCVPKERRLPPATFGFLEQMIAFIESRFEQAQSKS